MNNSKEVTNDPAAQSAPSNLATDLAWEFCRQRRSGNNPDSYEYLKRLPDEREREEFELLITMDEFTESAIDYQLQKEQVSLGHRKPSSSKNL